MKNRLFLLFVTVAAALALSGCGYNRFQTDVMFVSVLLLVGIVQVVQFTGNTLYRKLL